MKYLHNTKNNLEKAKLFKSDTYIIRITWIRRIEMTLQLRVGEMGRCRKKKRTMSQ